MVFRPNFVFRPKFDFRPKNLFKLSGVTGKQCTECEAQHYGFGLFDEGCKPCNCDPVGSVSGECSAPEDGGDEYVCECRPGVTGTKCDECMPGHYGRDSAGCKSCDCDMLGSVSEECDEEGKCQCKEGVQGRVRNFQKDFEKYLDVF